MALPANVNYCTVQGRFMSAVIDGADGDRNPDGVPLVGLEVEFTASVPYVKNPTAAPAPVLVSLATKTCQTDADGYLIGPDGVRGVLLVASDDPDLTPNGWTYHVRIKGQGLPQPIQFDFEAPSDEVVDLSTVAAVPKSTGPNVPAWLSEAQAARDAAVAAAAEAGAPTPESVAVAVTAYLTDNPVEWGEVHGAIIDQADLQAALGEKVGFSDLPGFERALTAGSGVTIDRTDPDAPVISATGGGASSFDQLGGSPSDNAALSAALNAKANASTVTTALAGKADAAEVTSALASKADVSELASKADVSELASKADVSAVAAKADTADLYRYTVSIHGNVARNLPGTSTPVPLNQTVIWISEDEPTSRMEHDIWYEYGASAPPEPTDIQFITSAFQRTGASNTSTTINLPSEVQAGDLIVVGVQGAASSVTIAQTSGPSLTSKGTNARTGLSTVVLTRTAVAGDGGQTVTFSLSSSTPAAVGVAVFRPAAPVLAAETANQGSGSASVTVPAFTPSSTTRALHVLFLMRGTAAAGTLTPPSGVTRVAGVDPGDNAATRAGIVFGLGGAPGAAVGNVWTNTSDHYAATWLLPLDVSG